VVFVAGPRAPDRAEHEVVRTLPDADPIVAVEEVEDGVSGVLHAQSFNCGLCIRGELVHTMLEVAGVLKPIVGDKIVNCFVDGCKGRRNRRRVVIEDVIGGFDNSVPPVAFPFNLLTSSIPAKELLQPISEDEQCTNVLADRARKQDGSIDVVGLLKPENVHDYGTSYMYNSMCF